VLPQVKYFPPYYARPSLNLFKEKKKAEQLAVCDRSEIRRD
jgi:hypothetical protein